MEKILEKFFAIVIMLSFTYALLTSTDPTSKWVGTILLGIILIGGGTMAAKYLYEQNN